MSIDLFSPYRIEKLVLKTTLLGQPLGTAPLMNPGKIDLPSVSQSLAPPVAPLEVMIKRDATLAMRDHSKGGKEVKVSRGELIAILKARQGAQADQAVVISADKNVRYEEVINVMDVLQQQHIRKVGLLTQAKSG